MWFNQKSIEKSLEKEPDLSLLEREIGRVFLFWCTPYRLRFQVPYSQLTLQRWFRMLRETIYQNTIQELKPLSGEIEMDETMFGGKRPGKRGWGATGKCIVFGIYQRNGKVLTFPISSRAKETMRPYITRYTQAGSLYYTDDWFAYTFLPIRGNHVVVLKEKGVPKGWNHINGIEALNMAINQRKPGRGLLLH